MIDRIASVLTVGLMALVLALFEMGSVAPRDAFFIASAIVIVFTGQQLIARDHLGFLEAAKSIVVRPQSYRSRTSFVAYVACLVLGIFVTAHVVALA